VSKASKASLEWFGADIQKALKAHAPAAIYSALEHIEDAAKANAPVDTGELKSSSFRNSRGHSNYRRSSAGLREPKPDKMSGYVGFSAGYARLVEYGTVKVNSKPFFRRAVDGKKHSVLKSFAAKFRELADE